MDCNIVFPIIVIVFVVSSLSVRIPIVHFETSFGLLLLLFFSYVCFCQQDYHEGFDAFSDFVQFPNAATTKIQTKFDKLIASVRQSMSGNAKTTTVDRSAFKCSVDASFCDGAKINDAKLQAHVNELRPIASMFEFMGMTPPLDAIIGKIPPIKEED